MDLNATAALLFGEAKRRSPAWVERVHPYGPGEDPDAEAGSIRLEIPVPDLAGHRIDVVQRGNTIEIRYDDGKPPGPAESLFVFQPGEESACIGAALDFVGSILNGRVRAVRERLPWWARLVVRADSALRFRERS